jgi:hypothetical protein
VKTKVYSGTVNLNVLVLDSVQASAAATDMATTDFEAIVGELWVGSFVGPCDTFPHPIQVLEGIRRAQVFKTPGGDDAEAYEVHLWRLRECIHS